MSVRVFLSILAHLACLTRFAQSYFLFQVRAIDV